MDEHTLAESVANLWDAACKHDGIHPASTFVVWSDSNPYAKSYNDAMGLLLELRGKRRESDRGDFAPPCDECGAPDGSGHYGICPNG